MNMKPFSAILAFTILCGCQTAPPPKPVRKVPPMPPLPPGMKAGVTARKASVPKPSVSFVPAAVSVGPNVFIQGYHVIPADPPFFPAYTNAFIAADQLSNNVLSIRMTNNLPTTDPATWFEPARFDCYPRDNLVAVSINITDPDNHHFRSINTPCPTSFASPATVETRTQTTNTVVIRGKTYRMIKLQRAGEDIRKAQRYRLVPQR